MDFGWTIKQQHFREQVAEFARHLPDDVVERDAASIFSTESWKACAEFGIQGMFVPKEFGGQASADILTSMHAMESMGKAYSDVGFLFALNAHMWTVQLPIQKFGTEHQKRYFLPKMCNGEWIGAHAVTEDQTGSDVFSLSTTAERCEGGYRLTGKKRLVTLGPIADLALVFATVDESKGRWGVTAFLVESSSEGYRASANMPKMGLRTVPLGEIFLEDCFVPESNRLGAEGAGFALSQYSLEYERCCILASQVGAMQRQLDKAISFAKQRQQFGQPIGKFQSVSNRIANMKMRVETAKLLLYKVAWLKQQEKPAMLEAALLKLHLSECYVDSSFDAIRIHGGRAYLTDEGIERDLRDAVGGVLYAGTSDIQRNIIAKLLGL